MKLNLLDQHDAEKRLAELQREATALESQLAINGANRPKPTFEGDVLHESELLEGYVAALRVSARTGQKPATLSAHRAPEKPKATETKLSRFTDTAGELRELEAKLEGGEIALKFYCAQLGERVTLTRPKTTDLATLREYDTELHAAMREAAQKCKAKGLVNPLAKGFEREAAPAKVAATPSPTPAPVRKLTATEKCLAAKSTAAKK